MSALVYVLKHGRVSGSFLTLKKKNKTLQVYRNAVMKVLPLKSQVALCDLSDYTEPKSREKWLEMCYIPCKH